MLSRVRGSLPGGLPFQCSDTIIAFLATGFTIKPSVVRVPQVAGPPRTPLFPRRFIEHIDAMQKTGLRSRSNFVFNFAVDEDRRR